MLRRVGIAMACCLSVRPSVYNVEVLWLYRLKFFDNNFTADWPNISSFWSTPKGTPRILAGIRVGHWGIEKLVSEYKTGNISERLKIERKLLFTTHRPKVVRGLSIAAKMDDLEVEWPPNERFRVIDSLNAAKMTKYSSVLTMTPSSVAGCIISIRPKYSSASALTYFFTCLHWWLWAHKTVNRQYLRKGSR